MCAGCACLDLSMAICGAAKNNNKKVCNLHIDVMEIEKIVLAHGKNTRQSLLTLVLRLESILLDLDVDIIVTLVMHLHLVMWVMHLHLVMWVMRLHLVVWIMHLHLVV